MGVLRSHCSLANGYRKISISSSSAGFDPNRLWVHYKRDNLEGYVQRPAGTVRTGFFGGMENLRRVEDPRRAVGSQVQVVSLIDLAGMS